VISQLHQLTSQRCGKYTASRGGERAIVGGQFRQIIGDQWILWVYPAMMHIKLLFITRVNLLSYLVWYLGKYHKSYGT
jgi:hypothetical protein